MRLVWVIGLLTALAVTGWHAPAAVQDAAPEPGALDFPLDPDPADCRVQPRPVDDLIALWFGPDGGPAAAPPIGDAPTAVTIPLGTPADEATVAGIVATVHEVYACFETGDFRRTTALFTDDLARGFGPGPEATEADARAFLGAPEPATEAEASEIVVIADVMVLADGQLGAFIVDRSEEEGTHVGYVLFARVGDRWLADGFVEFSPAGAEDVAE